MTRLVVGESYVAAGPATPPVTVTEIDETAGVYRTTGERQVASIIRFGCEDLWRPATAFDVRPTVPWWEERLAAFDIETTGTDVERDRIVTVAVTACGGGLATETFTALADPGIEIPDEAAAVHGITTARARAEGLPARDVVAATLATLASYCATSPLVVFNARFDLTILDREARRHGFEPLGEVLVIDPGVIDKWLDRYRKGSRKLDAICAAYGATLDDAHDASADALAAARAAWVLGKRGKVIRKAWNPGMERERAMLQGEWERVRYDMRLLHEAQVGWAHDQAVRLVEHFRSKGQFEDADSVNAEWPLVPSRSSVAA